jgi:Asp-tRNA(Asn)/Glu-tRNA(Gln) amidotransferase A subunit family amidase
MTVDARATAALKNAGAIILGKTNLYELALEGLSVSSLGWQTINPCDHTRTPGGSSGGTIVLLSRQALQCSALIFSLSEHSIEGNFG